VLLITLSYFPFRSITLVEIARNEQVSEVHTRMAVQITPEDEGLERYGTGMVSQLGHQHARGIQQYYEIMRMGLWQ
jgi:hypothetical protein